MVEWKRILCPVDFSETSRQALGVAADLARRHDAELVLLHVYQTPGVAYPEATVFAGEMEYRRFVDLIEETLAAWRHEAEEAGAPRVAIHAAPGAPYATIVDWARANGCDLIVMGTHGRTAVRRLLLGSVAEKVVRHAKCPVLTVRPHAAAHAEEPAAP